jgi:hypothetical protein
MGATRAGKAAAFCAMNAPLQSRPRISGRRNMQPAGSGPRADIASRKPLSLGDDRKGGDARLCHTRSPPRTSANGKSLGSSRIQLRVIN